MGWAICLIDCCTSEMDDIGGPVQVARHGVVCEVWGRRARDGGWAGHGQLRMRVKLLLQGLV